MKTQISEDDLLKTANSYLIGMPGYVEGMQITSAKMEKYVLVLTAELFLNETGGATQKTIKAMPIYDALSKELSEKYIVV